MNYHNLKIKGNNMFYESFKQKVDGSVEVTTASGETRFHKEYPDFKGTFQSAKLKEVEFDGKKFELYELSMLDPIGELWTLSVPLMDKWGLSDWAKQIARYIDQVNKGDDLTIGLNRKEKEKNDKYFKKVMFFKVGDTSLKHTYTKEQVPAGEQKAVTNPVTRKEEMKWNFDDQNAFLYDVLSRNAERLAYVREGQTEYVEADDSDDLPF